MHFKQADFSAYLAQLFLKFLSCVSTMTRNTDIGILSVHLSVRNIPLLDENGLTYCHSFFHHTVAQSFYYDSDSNQLELWNMRLVCT